MIYYPLSVLMLTGIRDVLVISTPHDLLQFLPMLGDGSSFGIHLSYAGQPFPDGLAQAFVIGEVFLDGGPSAFVLGDNIFQGDQLQAKCCAAAARRSGSTIFAYQESDPARYGVVSFGANGRATSIEEKPVTPRSN